MRSLTTAEFRQRLADVILEVAKTKKPVAIRRYQKHLVAVVPIEMLPTPVTPRRRTKQSP
jgi:PHD/YefM family antitoxin component YafN of YafNO toxin-antitoxin module